jgi:hypothetical protein
MTTLQAALTALALTYPTPDRGEPPDARAVRLDAISGAVVTFAAAWSAVRVISAGRAMCRWQRPHAPWLPATISAYATGGRCSYQRAIMRAEFVMRVEARLRAAVHSTDKD